MKKVAVTITYFRILLTCVLAALPTLSPIFLCVYSMCGLSNILTCLIIKTFKIEDGEEIKLDCYADLMFTLIILVKLLLELVQIMPQWCFVMIIVVGILKTLSGLFAMARFHRFQPLRTMLNRLTSIMLFIFPYLIVAFDVEIACGMLFLVAVIASFEELLCIVTLKEYNPDVRSIFCK